MQIIDLELDHNNFFCPVTGQAIIREEEEFRASPATVFCYLDGFSEFEFMSDEAKAIFDSLEIDEVEDNSEDIFKRFEEEYSDNNIICFVITTRGIACGPVSFTVRIGIQMNYMDETQ
jgi:hypothetical protein